MTEVLEYLDRERIKISFSNLIIRVSSINTYYGQLADFVKETGLFGVTNGKIYLMSEMMEPPYGLYNLVDQHLLPLGLEEGKDYIFVNEQMPRDLEGSLNPHLNQSHPDLENISWLDSIITIEGNYVWYVEDRVKNATAQTISQKEAS